MTTHDQAALRLFLVAGEHSGDALGSKLMAALKTARGADAIAFAGVGGDEMAHEGLTSLFAMEDVAVMGPTHIIPALPRIVRRVYQTVAAARAFNPHAVVIIDSPEFTHPIAKRIRRRMPQVPIIDYVSPSVWAWRSGRAKKMRGYVDEILGLLPFEPEAHKRLGGPHCTYVGHPLIERYDEFQGADSKGLAQRLGIAPDRKVLIVLPGSRRSEVDRLVSVFGETIARLRQSGLDFACLVPVVSHLKDKIAAATSNWPGDVHLVMGAADKYAAMRLGTVALAASGTVTLELALAGLPMVVAYKIDEVTAIIVRRLITTDTAILANLVLGEERPFPQFIQEDCTAEKLADAVGVLMTDTPERRAQLEALGRVPGKLLLSSGSPSEAAARAVLSVVDRAKQQSS
ncbi:MAG: lipid-A-disaccharide synthase [Hyphomicrobium sp.]